MKLMHKFYIDKMNVKKKFKNKTLRYLHIIHKQYRYNWVRNIAGKNQTKLKFSNQNLP